MTPVLLIGYGNSLRRDDGIGPAVVDRFAGRHGVRVWNCHQLTPELADELAQCERAVFVDAAICDGGPIQVREVASASNSTSLGHVCDPGWLLGLAGAVYGRCPEAWLVTVPIGDIGFGIGLSVKGERMVDAAVRIVDELIGGPGCTKSV